ncbi:MAG: HAMP domain-containing histidine kinase [Lachnospiraceae bacterium]|nr:HAMP domain-containing histidine kinase [Lachnospiraceae bacterium]
MKKYLLPTVVMVLLAVFFVLCRGRFNTDIPVIGHEDGYADIRGYDLSHGVYHLVNNWDCFPGTLYTPADFEDESTAPVPDNECPRNKTLGTYRMRIVTRPKQWLSICGFSVDFGTRVFVNGQEVLNVGYVSDDPAKAIPKSRYMTYPMYSGDKGEIEIIYQYSNYVHNDGGFVQTTYIGTPQNIDEYRRGIAAWSLTIGGGLIFLMFWFMLTGSIQKSREFMALALCCLVIALRNQYFFAEYMLDPAYNFYWEYRLVVLDVSLIPASATYLLYAFYPKAIGKKTAYILTGLFTILTCLHWILDTKALVALCHVSYYSCIPFLIWSIYALWKYFTKEHKADRTDLISLGAVGIFVVMLIIEGASTGSNQMINHFGIMPMAMVLCLMLLAVVINGRIEKKMLALEQEREKTKLLEKVNDMNRDFLRMVAHELKTPLTVISGYAQLCKRQLEKQGETEKVTERLNTIKDESERMAAIVNRLMDYTYNRDRNAEMGAVDVKELLNNAVSVMTPVCLKNGNTLEIQNGCTRKIYGNHELLLQVLINLIANASRHTMDGTIIIETAEEEDNGVFLVSDTGCGIPEDVLPHIFEKGFTTGEGNGLGLAICRETVEMHGGTMELVSTGPEGTKFAFTIPAEGEKHGL